MAITSPQQVPDDWNAVVAANLRAQLALLGWNQAQLAAALGMTEMWISRRLKGGAKLLPDDIVMFADFFQVPINDLFKTKKAPTPKGEGQRLPEMDSNHQPADVQPEHIAPVATLPVRAVEVVEHSDLATVHSIFERSAS